MNNIISKVQDFYASHSCFSDPRKYSYLLDSLPSDISELVDIVQGVIFHKNLDKMYGVNLSEIRKQEANFRFVYKQLEQIQKLDINPLNISQQLEKRLVGTCRDFSVFLCSLLRHKGIPARARCGFGTYFTPGQNEDHWICEYWNADEKRWIMVDAQLDKFQCKTFKINFNPLDIPEGLFLTAGKAWQMCRMENVDPDKFGIFDMHGLWIIRGNIIRDLASLNKMELLPWDCWGLIEENDNNLSDDDFKLLDKVALLTLSDESSFSEILSIYKTNKGLDVPAVISSYIIVEDRFQKVDIAQDCASVFLQN